MTEVNEEHLCVHKWCCSLQPGEVPHITGAGQSVVVGEGEGNAMKAPCSKPNSLELCD